MTTSIGQVPSQHPMPTGVGEVRGSVQPTLGAQIFSRLRAAIGVCVGASQAPSLEGRVRPQPTQAIQTFITSEVLNAIRRKGGCKFLRENPRFRDDPVIVLAVVQEIGSALEFASRRLQDDPAIVLASVANNGYALNFASSRLREDPAIVLASVEQNGFALQYASERLQDDPAIVLAAVANNGYALMCASLRLRDDHDFILAAVEQNGDALKYASPRLADYPDIVLAAVEQDVHAFKYASLRLQDDHATVLRVIQQNGCALKDASSRFRDDPAMVLEAVAQNSIPILYASRRVRDDPNFILAAFSQNPQVRRWIPKPVLDDFVKQARAQIDTKPSLFSFLPKEEVTLDRAKRAVEVNPLLLRWVPAEIQAALDTNVLRVAVMRNPAVLNLIDPLFLSAEIVEAVSNPPTGGFSPASYKALQDLAYRARTGVIPLEIANPWINSLANVFNDDKEFMDYAITHQGIDLAVASERLRDDEDIVLAAIRLDRSQWDSVSVRFRADPPPAVRELMEMPFEV